MVKTIQQTIIDLKAEIGEIEIKRRKLKDFISLQLNIGRPDITDQELFWMQEQLKYMSHYQDCLTWRIYLLARKYDNEIN